MNEPWLRLNAVGPCKSIGELEPGLPAVLGATRGLPRQNLDRFFDRSEFPENSLTDPSTVCRVPLHPPR